MTDEIHVSHEHPRRAGPADFPAILALVKSAFAYMDGRVDPPSSMHGLTEADLAAAHEVLVIGPAGAPLACAVLTPKPDALYIGKVAVAGAARGQGLARRLFTEAEARAGLLGLAALELQSRVELTENHAVFAALGFSRTGETAHPGYDRPTSYTFRKTL